MKNVRFIWLKKLDEVHFYCSNSNARVGVFLLGITFYVYSANV